MDSIIASKSSLLFIPRGRTRRGIERTREARAGEVSVVASMAPATSTQLEQLDELTDEMFAEALATSTSGDVQSFRFLVGKSRTPGAKRPRKMAEVLSLSIIDSTTNECLSKRKWYASPCFPAAFDCARPYPECKRSPAMR